MTNPYSNLSPVAFWKPAVSSKSLFNIDDLWTPKYRIDRNCKVATFGSCFAQNFSRELIAREYQWMNTEPAPFGLSAENQQRLNYGVFSCRTTNIYTTSLLRQWVELSLRLRPPPAEVWRDRDRWIDPLRPAVEPDGFNSEVEMLASREQTLTSFREILEKCDVFVFTLGLTESWINIQTGYEYQLCPETHGGVFDPEIHKFVNQGFTEILEDLLSAIASVRRVNPTVRFLLTVSPVPLTATMSGQHVLVATTMSKSILRAVCAEVTNRFPFVDYFPSYEIVSSPVFKGVFFEPNLRNVTQAGVGFIMKAFFAASSEELQPAPVTAAPRRPRVPRREEKHGSAPVTAALRRPRVPRREEKHGSRQEEELVCEEQLLAALGPSQ